MFRFTHYMLIAGLLGATQVGISQDTAESDVIVDPQSGELLDAWKYVDSEHYVDGWLKVDPYLVIISRPIDDLMEDNRTLTIRKGNQILFKDQEVILDFFGNWQGESFNNPTDFDRDGTPNLLLEKYTLGAHCCHSYLFIELSDPITVQELHTDNAGMQWLEDIDKDGREEFLTRDDTFAYWNECYAGSPQPDVILEYDKNDRVVVDPEAMKQDPPEAKELKKWARELNLTIRERYLECLRSGTLEEAKKAMVEGSGTVPTQLWGVMLDLLYTGNEKEAWAFFDQSWPENYPGKEEFRKDFLEQLNTSPFWQQYQKLTAAKSAE